MSSSLSYTLVDESGSIRANVLDIDVIVYEYSDLNLGILSFISFTGVTSTDSEGKMDLSLPNTDPDETVMVILTKASSFSDPDRWSFIGPLVTI